MVKEKRRYERQRSEAEAQYRLQVQQQNAAFALQLQQMEQNYALQREQALQNFQLQQLEREQAYQQEREALIREREQELAITNRAYAARLRMEAEYANQIMAIGQRIQSSASAGGIGTATNSGSKGFTQSGLAGTSGRGGDRKSVV